MEKLIAAGALAGVIDYTLSELANGVRDGLHSTGPARLTVAGEHGVPPSRSPGLRRLLVPTRGFALADVEGGDLWDADADAAFVDALEASLRDGIAFERVGTHVNDPAFADLVAARYLALVSPPVPAA